MHKITDIFRSKDKTFSFELFPPKTEQGFENLKETIAHLSALSPDFFSCTYGAGGGNRDKTFDICQMIEQKHKISAMAHLTCVLNTKNDIRIILEDVRSRGLKNILALRGDAPQDNPHWKPTDENFRYSSELCAFIKHHFKNDFSVGVAGFPEGHVLCPDREKDAQYLKIKVEAGADFVVTQLFFNNNDYFEYVERLMKHGVETRVIPGILPITDYNALLRFTALCGASVTKEVKDIFEPIKDDKERTMKAGIDLAIRQCRDLLDNGAPGLHFYTLNKISPTQEVLNAVRL